MSYDLQILLEPFPKNQYHYCAAFIKLFNSFLILVMQYEILNLLLYIFQLSFQGIQSKLF